MATWRSHSRIFALLLAILVAAGFGLSAVQATTMPVRMSTTADIGSYCDYAACPVGTRDDGCSICCPQLCIAPVAVLPQDLVVGTNVQKPLPFLSLMALLHGRNSLPDPFPPRAGRLV
jgi:hypothetical protein